MTAEVRPEKMVGGDERGSAMVGDSPTELADDGKGEEEGAVEKVAGEDERRRIYSELVVGRYFSGESLIAVETVKTRALGESVDGEARGKNC